MIAISVPTRASLPDYQGGFRSLILLSLELHECTCQPALQTYLRVRISLRPPRPTFQQPRPELWSACRRIRWIESIGLNRQARIRFFKILAPHYHNLISTMSASYESELCHALDESYANGVQIRLVCF